MDPRLSKLLDDETIDRELRIAIDSLNVGRKYLASVMSATRMSLSALAIVYVTAELENAMTILSDVAETMKGES